MWGTGAFADCGLYGATYCRVFNKSCPVAHDRAFEAGTSTLSPVRGFHALPASRDLVEKVP